MVGKASMKTACGILIYLFFSGRIELAAGILLNKAPSFGGKYILTPIMSHSIGGLSYANVISFFSSMSDRSRMTGIVGRCNSMIDADRRYLPIPDYDETRGVVPACLAPL